MKYEHLARWLHVISPLPFLVSKRNISNSGQLSLQHIVYLLQRNDFINLKKSHEHSSLHCVLRSHQLPTLCSILPCSLSCSHESKRRRKRNLSSTWKNLIVAPFVLQQLLSRRTKVIYFFFSFCCSHLDSTSV